MQRSLSTEGCNRVMADWEADEALADETGQTDQYGKQWYYIALIGAPSDSSPWMWQWAGTTSPSTPPSPPGSSR
jgi:hypothetical protein